MSPRSTVTVRDLRNEFPKVKKLVEEQGEVVVSEQGIPRYRLVLYTAATGKRRARPKDYLARLLRYQPRPSTASQARALHDENRGSR